MKIERTSTTLIHLEEDEIKTAIRDFIEQKIDTVNAVPPNANFTFTVVDGENLFRSGTVKVVVEIAERE